MVTVQDGTREYRLTGRVEAIVLYLAQQAKRLNELPKVRLEFNCAGFKSVQPKIEVVEDKIPIG